MAQRGVPTVPKTSLGDKMRQMTEQQRLIEERKKEIEKKLKVLQQPQSAGIKSKAPVTTGKM